MNPETEARLYNKVRPFVISCFKGNIPFSELVANIDNAAESFGRDTPIRDFELESLLDLYHKECRQ